MLQVVHFCNYLCLLRFRYALFGCDALGLLGQSCLVFVLLFSGYSTVTEPSLILAASVERLDLIVPSARYYFSLAGWLNIFIWSRFQVYLGYFLSFFYDVRLEASVWPIPLIVAHCFSSSASGQLTTCMYFEEKVFVEYEHMVRESYKLSHVWQRQLGLVKPWGMYIEYHINLKVIEISMTVSGHVQELIWFCTLLVSLYEFLLDLIENYFHSIML